MMAAAPQAAAYAMGMARAMARIASATSSTVAMGHRLMDTVPRQIVDDIFAHALKKQTGVSLKYMMDFGANPIERQLILSAQFLHKELPVRLAHRVAELENLPYGLSAKSNILKVNDCDNCHYLFACFCARMRPGVSSVKMAQYIQVGWFHCR